MPSLRGNFGPHKGMLLPILVNMLAVDGLATGFTPPPLVCMTGLQHFCLNSWNHDLILSDKWVAGLLNEILNGSVRSYDKQMFVHSYSWWRYQMETFSALPAICAGNSPVAGEFPAQRPVTRSFDVFSDLRLNIRLSKQSWGWWFETPSRPLWRHCNVAITTASHPVPNVLQHCWIVIYYQTGNDKWQSHNQLSYTFL